MEEYANFGLDFMQEKLEQNPNYFFKETGFLDVFTSFLKQENEDNLVSDEPEDLD